MMGGFPMGGWPLGGPVSPAMWLQAQQQLLLNPQHQAWRAAAPAPQTALPRLPLLLQQGLPDRLGGQAGGVGDGWAATRKAARDRFEQECTAWYRERWRRYLLAVGYVERARAPREGVTDADGG